MLRLFALNLVDRAVLMLLILAIMPDFVIC